MHARLLLASVRSVEEAAEALLEMRSLRDRAAVGTKSRSAIQSLMVLGRQLYNAAPFPPVSLDHDDRDRTVEQTIETVLETVYEAGEVEMTALAEDHAAIIEDSDRFSVSGSTVTVPLPSSGEGARNWYPVLEFVIDRVKSVLSRFESVALRRRAVCTAARTSCDSVVAMLETLVDVIERALAWNKFVRRQLNAESDMTAFAEWTAHHFDGSDHA